MQVHVREGTRCAHIAPQTIEFWRRHVSRPGEVDAENASIRPGPSPIASTRSANSTASSTEWVTKMAVTPVYTVEEIADRASRVLPQALENGISRLRTHVDVDLRHALWMVAYFESENASVSISMKMRPSVPTQL
jgi:hypothetical protein